MKVQTEKRNSFLKEKNERLQSLYKGDEFFTPHVNSEGFAYNCEFVDGVRVSSEWATNSRTQNLEDKALELIENPNVVGVTNTGYVVYWDI